MHVAKLFLLGTGFTLLLTGCVKKVCPAYQSMFLLNGRERTARFSLFESDSIPKTVAGVNKDRHLLIVAVAERKKERSFHTIPARMIFPDRMETGADTTYIASEPDEQPAKGR